MLLFFTNYLLQDKPQLNQSNIIKLEFTSIVKCDKFNFQDLKTNNNNIILLYKAIRV